MYSWCVRNSSKDKATKQPKINEKANYERRLTLDWHRSSCVDETLRCSKPQVPYNCEWDCAYVNGLPALARGLDVVMDLCY